MAEHKKALSEAASFFVWSPSSLGLKGASSPFLVGPARRNRWHFSGSLLVSKENNPRPAAARRNRRALAALNTRHLLRKPVCGLKAPLGLSCPPGTAVLSGSLLVSKENNPRPAAAHRNRRALAALNTRHLLRKPVCGLKSPTGAFMPSGHRRPFWFSFGAKREQSPPGSSASKSPCPCRAKHAAFASQTGLRLKSPTGAFMTSGHRRPFWFSFGAKREHPLSKPLSPAAPPPPAGPARPAGRRPAAPRSRSAPRRCRAAHAEPARPQKPLPAP